MYFSKFAKKVLAVAVAVAVTASSVVATPSTKKADAASYKAYLCRQRSLHSEISMMMQSFQTNFRTRQTNCQKTVQSLKIPQ